MMRIISGSVLVLLLLAASAAQGWTPQRLGIDEGTLTGLMEKGWSLEETDMAFCVRLEIDRDGKVQPDVRPATRWMDGVPPPPFTEAMKRDQDRMLALARGLRFRPATWDGVPVAAMGTVCFPKSMVRTEDWLENPPDFPAITRWEEVEVGLRRTPCFGSCPVYDVTITGTGKIQFTGSTLSLMPGPERGVLMPGEHKDRIEPSAAKALVDRFRQARFLSMRDEYDSKVVDGSFTILWLKIGETKKRVFSNEGENMGQPAAFDALVKAIDSAAGTARWVKGDVGTVPYMLDQGYDFGSPGVLSVAREAMRRGNEPVLAGLADQGLPLDHVMPGSHLSDYDFNAAPLGDLTLGQGMLLTAMRFNLPGLFTRLRERGWLERTPAPLLQQITTRFVPRHPDILNPLVAAGIKPPTRTQPDKTAPAERCPVLSRPTATQVTGEQEMLLLECTKELLRRGVKLDRAEADGYRYVDHAALASLMVARYLLTEGPQPRLPPDEEGYWHVGIGHDATILTLLQAGVDPRGRNGTASALRKAALEKPLPATLEWLDTQGGD
ncbi:DUF6438 domain-containing protein [Niveispirillum sp.]|uniref:DUF6438 domain-containing protein n=1 Tax=Niveispirillum sp. TaxID=1917217 RepID=UPI001B51C111|nr:DUF6438 domain-containing protein [Niveispirillum sp.]MBP7335351.1 hypothetical protein [Niveispirillum sp.]